MGEILHDTNVLMDFFKEGRTELDGYTSIFNILEFPKGMKFSRLKVIYPLKKDYDQALKISVKLLKAGKPVPLPDLLIAAICFNRGLTLDTKDEHFLSIRSAESEFKVRVKKRRPRSS